MCRRRGSALWVLLAWGKTLEQTDQDGWVCAVSQHTCVHRMDQPVFPTHRMTGLFNPICLITVFEFSRCLWNLAHGSSLIRILECPSVTQAGVMTIVLVRSRECLLVGLYIRGSDGRRDVGWDANVAWAGWGQFALGCASLSCRLVNRLKRANVTGQADDITDHEPYRHRLTHTVTHTHTSVVTSFATCGKSAAVKSHEPRSGIKMKDNHTQPYDHTTNES